MAKRFFFVHEFLSYKDYNTDLGPNEPYKRLTIVNDKHPWAYLTLRDWSEKRITIEEAYQLLQEEVPDVPRNQ